MGLTTFDLTRLLDPVARGLAGRFPQAWTAARRARFALRLLLGGRLAFFAVVDALIVLSTLFEALGEGGRIPELFRSAVLIPSLVLGVPALADLVAVERRAGSLELALVVPAPLAYFLRRAATVGAILLVQGAIVLVVAWVIVLGGSDQALAAIPAEGGLLLRALVQAAVVVALVVSTVLFWAVRLRGAGAVLIASGLTLAALLPWITSGPGLAASPDRLLGIPTPLLAWSGDLAVLGGTAAVFYAYARDRLRRPGTLLT